MKVIWVGSCILDEGSFAGYTYGGINKDHILHSLSSCSYWAVRVRLFVCVYVCMYTQPNEEVRFLWMGRHVQATVFPKFSPQTQNDITQMCVEDAATYFTLCLE